MKKGGSKKNQYKTTLLRKKTSPEKEESENKVLRGKRVNKACWSQGKAAESGCKGTMLVP